MNCRSCGHPKWRHETPLGCESVLSPDGERFEPCRCPKWQGPRFRSPVVCAVAALDREWDRTESLGFKYSSSQFARVVVEALQADGWMPPDV